MRDQDEWWGMDEAATNWWNRVDAPTAPAASKPPGSAALSPSGAKQDRFPVVISPALAADPCASSPIRPL